MTIKLIKTEEEYSRALSRIEELMDAKPGTPEADELELLATLVEMYEEVQFPMRLPDPIDAVKFRMEQLGLGQKDLIPFIGGRSKVSEILNRKKPLSLSMMRALHKSLGIPAEVLLNEPGASFPSDLPKIDWNRFPLKEMAKKGWLSNSREIKNKAEELLRGLIEQAGGVEAVYSILFRKGKSARQNEKADSYALVAWCLRVLALARKTELKGKFKRGTLTQEILRDIAKLSYLENGPVLAEEYLNKLGIIMLIVPHLSRTYLDGAALSLADGRPVIAFTLRYDRIDNFWFCLLHELGHVAEHLDATNEIIVDDLDLRGHEAEIRDDKEDQADRLAEEALIPGDRVEKSFFSEHASAAEVEAVAEKLRIHPAIVAGRIRFEKNNYRLLSKYVGNKAVRKQFKREYYKDNCQEKANGHELSTESI
jgi:HTH-type transcriptional regulator/antitoxin HigA